jgi:CelD/BcsL family acetyltransferase involved in cellulose biosynthesis
MTHRITGVLDPLDGSSYAGWAELFSSSPTLTGYLSPYWVKCWIQEFGSELRTRRLEVDEDGALVGTCLLTSRTIRGTILPLVRLYLNTDGESPADRVVVEYNQVLAKPGFEEKVCSVFADCVRSSRADELIVAGASEATVARLTSHLSDWRADVEWRDSPFVDLRGLRRAGTDHMSVLSSNTRAHVRRAIRRYEQRGPLRVDLASTTEEAAEMLEHLIDLHQKRWAAKGQSGGFASPHRRSFHRNFVRNGHPSGAAQLLRVRAGDAVIGVLYFVVANGHVAFYQSGFHYEDDPQLKPGLISHHLAINHYLSAGYDEYDFLPSGPGEGHYKKSLSNDSRRLATLVLARPGWRNRFFDALRWTRRMWKSRPTGSKILASP